MLSLIFNNLAEILHFGNRREPGEKLKKRIFASSGNSGGETINFRLMEHKLLQGTGQKAPLLHTVLTLQLLPSMSCR